MPDTETLILAPKGPLEQDWACAQCGLSVRAGDVHWCKPQTPTLDKVLRIAEQSQRIGEFLDWLGEQGYHIAVWQKYSEHPSSGQYLEYTGKRPDDLLHDYFGIDAAAEEREKRALLEWTRAINAAD